jgi:hypothetical protein
MVLVSIHPELLLAIALLLSALSIVLAVSFRGRAPAASISLLAAVAVGATVFMVAEGPRHVPALVAEWATAGLVVGGVIGLLMAPGRPPAKRIRRAALWTLAVSPVAGAALTLTLLEACPLYVTGQVGYCYHGIDLLGGWISEVVALFMASAVWLAVVLFASSWQAARSRGAGRKD